MCVCVCVFPSAAPTDLHRHNAGRIRCVPARETHNQFASKCFVEKLRTPIDTANSLLNLCEDLHCSPPPPHPPIFVKYDVKIFNVSLMHGGVNMSASVCVCNLYEACGYGGFCSRGALPCGRGS